MNTWQEAQQWEAGWWENCLNTYGEEEKQLLYARKMGLAFFHDGRSPYNIDMGFKSVIDIGGGPVSLLLKCTKVYGLVVDPLDVPKWVEQRYEDAGIELLKQPAEDLERNDFDEAWLYNVLQHTFDPHKVVQKARQAANIVRVFEWINTVTNVGHPHAFTRALLDEWLGGQGKVERLNGQANCHGDCYYGIFLGTGEAHD